ncbi:outer membrane transport energization protein ExbD [Yoonia maricola]|uniref:Outer membrane transport energization protein ExbD n=1 Tax=Yoonia maricola TaxID=420999 RepID=A0A2M8W034_9RHOB|nr:outer membrane transport energization protein ExbD [Yoonia maricola]
MSLTPLVDVIFLLLLFFMLTSTFSRYGEIEVSAAASGAGAASGAAFLQLGEADVRLAGRPVAFSSLPAELTGARVLVSLEPGVSSQRLIDLLAVLRAVPDLSLTVLQ